ncbi:hypothetical protein PDE_05546 [Penicillium oxalicum 114-2]|uniref:Uncharacterized protein n=1 Tax=Penicillium oxalicum (strain 114-2 / CGMCC 5302) TaxID=933388 RepID=S7ZJV4_PENO1|nr:hypothetical protein PDE_05546 [Penicillium oxalicum 114-2]
MAAGLPYSPMRVGGWHTSNRQNQNLGSPEAKSPA